MTYFILHKEEKKENLMFSSNQLGEESLGSFYPEQGWVALMNMNYTILDEKGGKYTMTEFLDKVEKLKIKSA